jgi:hypothetical protein
MPTETLREFSKSLQANDVRVPHLRSALSGAQTAASNGSMINN